MSKLQALEEKVQVMPSMIRSTIALLDHMLSLNEALFERELYDDSEREEISQALNAMRMRVEGYLATSIALETRINGIFKLVKLLGIIVFVRRLILDEGLKRHDPAHTNHDC